MDITGDPERASSSDVAILVASLSEPERFSEIFERHFPTIHSYLSRRVGTTMADDLASQVFVIAFERRRNVDGEHASIRPWLYGIASNLLRNHARSERRRSGLVDRLQNEANQVSNDFDTAESAADRRRIARALSRLDPNQREALLLHAWEGLTYVEIAEVLDVPPGTVASRIARGTRRLRSALEQPSPTPTNRVEVLH